MIPVALTDPYAQERQRESERERERERASRRGGSWFRLLHFGCMGEERGE